MKESLSMGYKYLFYGIRDEEKEIFYFDDNHSDFYSACMIISDYYNIPLKTDAKSKRTVINEDFIEVNKIKQAVTIIDKNGLPITQTRTKLEYNILVEEENF